MALILPAGLVLAELLILLSARYAKAPEPTLSFIEKQAQKALVALHAYEHFEALVQVVGDG